jgi:predicted nucleotide-binding protein
MASLQAIKEAEKKLARRWNKVQTSSGYEPIGTAILGLIEAVQSSSVLKEIAERLYVIEDNPSVEEWEKTNWGGWLTPPVQRNKKARLCYEILNLLYNQMGESGNDFTQGICHIGSIISRESKLDICAREFVDNFVDPFVEYLDEELEDLIADEEVKDEDVAVPRPENKRTVFIVHGRDKRTLQSVVEYLEKSGLKPLTFEEAKELVETSVPTILEVVDKGMAAAQAVIVLLTPDDEARLKEGGEALRGQARPNVIFEAGIAFGRYRKRTVLVEYEELSVFSDLHGFYVVRLKDGYGGIEGLEDLRKQLKVAGCELD